MVDLLERLCQQLVWVEKRYATQPLEFQGEDTWSMVSMDALQLPTRCALSKKSIPSFGLVSMWPVSLSPTSDDSLLLPEGIAGLAVLGRKPLVM